MKIACLESIKQPNYHTYRKETHVDKLLILCSAFSFIAQSMLHHSTRNRVYKIGIENMSTDWCEHVELIEIKCVFVISNCDQEVVSKI